jgi:hypothetical protein
LKLGESRSRQVQDASAAEHIDWLLCALLRGEETRWPQPEGATYIESFLKRVDYHGVSGLLDEKLKHLETWPNDLRDAIHGRALKDTARELFHQQVLIRLHAELVDIGVRPLILKGTALAYALYPDQRLRTRSDTDILILETDRSKAHRVLRRLGFEPVKGVSGEFISYEKNYTFRAAAMGELNVDLHWRISNSELLSRLFSYEELLDHAIYVPKLCPHALGLGPVHAMLIACMHRVTHKQNPYYVNGIAYYGADRLIWLYDIHLLAMSFSSDQWRELLTFAKDKGLCATCLDGLQAAKVRFHTGCPDFVCSGLAKPGVKERPTTYLNATKLRQEWMNFCALEASTKQLKFLRELFFPPVDYMRMKYPEPRWGWMPILYARRAIDGFIARAKLRGKT